MAKPKPGPELINYLQIRGATVLLEKLEEAGIIYRDRVRDAWEFRARLVSGEQMSKWLEEAERG